MSECTLARGFSKADSNPVVCSHHVLNSIRVEWIAVEVIAACQILLDTAGYNWILLDTAGYYWILLDTTGYCWNTRYARYAGIQRYPVVSTGSLQKKKASQP